MTPVRLPRRSVLRGLGGVMLALPFLEGLAPRSARAQGVDRRYAIFFRQANGVAQANNNGELGQEPERFFPTELGALTEATMSGRAVDELLPYRQKLLVVRNVNMDFYNFGDGHAAGAMQGLTARGPQVGNQGGNSEAGGESIDHRIGRELNPEGRESIVTYCGQGGGWLNGPCISHRGAGQRRTAVSNPFTGYQNLIGGGGNLTDEVQQQIAVRGKSVNDLVRDQLTRLRGSARLSSADRARLELHTEAVRDLEVGLVARFTADEEAALEGAAPGFDSTDGDQVLETARLHMDVIALAVSAGLTRAAVVQVGQGNDGATRYRNADGSQMENYHFISHRRLSHGADGNIIGNADVLHHRVDRLFAQTFRHLLDRLSSYPGQSGGTLLDEGLSCWYNDNASGPPHAVRNVPWVIAGSANGFMKQGECVALDGGGVTHRRLLNTIGTAVGCTDGAGGPMTDFGDPNSPTGLAAELRA